MCTKESKYGQLIASNIFFITRLKELGILTRYTGFYFLVDILDLWINDEMTIKSFSREIYPVVAKKYNKNECTVERNIRNLIDKVWNYDLSVKLDMEWNERYKPTCHSFLKGIKNYIMAQIS